MVIDLDDDVIQNNRPRRSAKPRKEFRAICKVYPPIEIDDDSSSDVLYQGDDSDVILLNKNDNSNKENAKKSQPTIKTYNKPKRKRGRPRNIDLAHRRIQKKQNNVTNKRITSSSQIDMSNMYLDRDLSNPGVLLEPRVAVEVDMVELNQNKIKDVEAQIAQLKKRLEILEKAEVITDCVLSPYLQCEQ